VNEDTSGATYRMSKEPSPISQNSKKVQIPQIPQYTPHTVATPGECWVNVTSHRCYVFLSLCFKNFPTQSP